MEGNVTDKLRGPKKSGFHMILYSCHMIPYSFDMILNRFYKIFDIIMIVILIITTNIIMISILEVGPHFCQLSCIFLNTVVFSGFLMFGRISNVFPLTK